MSKFDIYTAIQENEISNGTVSITVKDGVVFAVDIKKQVYKRVKNK
tara:strand:- start:946 stop:1083 length:138 start_codon:yes stop_codon:yes gene_type:complete